MRIQDTLTFACGDWRVERVLVDHRAGTRGSFTGRAVLRLATGGEASAPDNERPAALAEPAQACKERAATYEERGIVRFGAHRGPAARGLAWRGLPDGTADVRFADGGPFYPLDLREGRWEASHLCGPDSYEVSHLVIGDDQRAERWRVFGPAKDYETVTVFTRRQGPGAAR